MTSWKSAWREAHWKEKENGENSPKRTTTSRDIVTSPTSSSTMNFLQGFSLPFSSNIPSPTVTIDSNFPWSSWSSEHATFTTKSSYPTQRSGSSTFRTKYTQYSEQSDSQTPTPVASEDVTLSPTSAETGGLDDDNPGLQPKQADHMPVYAAAAIIPVLLVAAVGFLLFFCMKKRKKQQQMGATQAKVQEMGARTPHTVSAYMAPIPPASREPSYTAPPRHPPPASPPPVILGPISAGANGNYFTGIDTSDAVSMRSNVRHDHTGLGDPFADRNSLNEEPPPPYRPSSVPALSRDTSLRSTYAPPMSSQTYLIDSRGELLRSPFVDPRDDDAVSEIYNPTLGRNRDDLSVVSDLSYQHDPVVNRPNV
ncbi:hypothetical protein P280DRAFT_516917 [Massarina eburnea CBS 473.64]|uniref:Uncharacterized protein n=1 Tax=Massarina eburnea CBS 473.64 TaxID=1395130 RepID=A0A6A6S2Y0_9PLEO|nr:hypothetical protein P280DRAFT_516917 [Massarina eburnea CBS 473.64]